MTQHYAMLQRNLIYAGVTRGKKFVMLVSCSIPDVCIEERRLPLFIARATLRDLIAGLEARATGGAAR